jgi:hypothetical protein
MIINNNVGKIILSIQTIVVISTWIELVFTGYQDLLFDVDGL